MRCTCHAGGYSFKSGLLQRPTLDWVEQRHSLLHWCTLIVDPIQTAEVGNVTRKTLLEACAGGSAKWARGRISRDTWSTYCANLGIEVSSSCLHSFDTAGRDIGLSSGAYPIRGSDAQFLNSSSSAAMCARPNSSIIMREAESYFAPSSSSDASH